MSKNTTNNSLLEGVVRLIDHAESLPNFKGLAPGQRPSIEYKKKYYLSIVDDNSPTLSVGDTGIIMIQLPTDALLHEGITEGDKVSLKAGAETIGSFEIKSIIRRS